MGMWTQESALAELEYLLRAIPSLIEQPVPSADHSRWQYRALALLGEVFGEASLYYVNFIRTRWRYSGTMLVDVDDAKRPGRAEARYDRPVYLSALERSHGLLLAARDELIRKGMDNVYKGKNTGPEASLILRIINLAELKLRKTIRSKPEKEREVQDAFENLLIGADIPHSHEKESIEYSSKTYIPDFTVAKADLAIDIKLATAQAHEKEFIPQINDDILAYRTKYGNLFFVVYDCGIIRDVDRFVGSFEAQGAVYVRVVKH